MMESDNIKQMEEKLFSDTEKMEDDIREKEKEIMDDIENTIHVLKDAQKNHIF